MPIGHARLNFCLRARKAGAYWCPEPDSNRHDR